MKAFLRFFFCVSLFVQLESLQAITIYARQDGDWDQTDRWSTAGVGGVSCGCTPAAGDDVIIDGYDIVIDAGTGSVTVNSLVLRSDTRDDNALLRIEDGMQLTISGDLTIFGNRATRDQTLQLIDNNTRISVGDDFIVDQNAGDDVIIDVEFNSRIDVVDDMNIDKDGGDDIDIRLNENNGTAAVIDMNGDFIITADNYDSDGIEILLNGSACDFDVGGNFNVAFNTATTDAGFALFDINAGDMTIAGAMTVVRADDCGDVIFDMDGGNLSANSMSVNSSGTNGGARAVSFFVDDDSQINIAGNWDVTMTSGDDFNLEINVNNGTTAQVNIGSNFTITRSNGDDINIYVDDDNSRLDVNGNLTITSSGGEQLTIELDNTATIDVGGNFSVTHSQGQAGLINLLGGAGDSPLFQIGANCIITVSAGGDTYLLDIAGGTMAVGANCLLNLNGGGGDMNLRIDGAGVMTVGSDFISTLSGSDDLSIGLGENSANSTARLDVAGHMQMIHNFNNAGSTMNFRIYDNTEVECNELTLTTNFTTPPIFLTEVDNNAVLDIDGDLNLNAPASGELELRISTAAKMEIMGNIVRAALPNRFGEIDCNANGTIEYNGNSAQIIAADAGSGGDFVHYDNLIINNSFGTSPQLTMEGLATAHASVTFSDGIVQTTATNILVVATTASVSSASNNSHVDGPVRKVGAEAFEFPVGNAGNFQPIAISSPTTVTDAFEAQYFQTDPHPTYNDASLAVGIDHVSSCEYWMLNRTNGVSEVSVTLNWDANSCGVTDLTQLLVAKWNGTQWLSEGNGGTTGSTTTGNVTTTANVSSFSPFTLASSTVNNPLPITLLGFSANPENNKVKTVWKTASEQNNKEFDVQRSVDAIEWETFAKVQGKGTVSEVTEYFAYDNQPLPQTSYYRLKQIDINGRYTFSPLVSVYFAGNKKLKLYPSPANAELTIELADDQPVELFLFDVAGRKIPLLQSTSEGKIIVNTSTLADGYYTLKIESELNTEVVSIVISGN